MTLSSPAWWVVSVLVGPSTGPSGPTTSARVNAITPRSRSMSRHCSASSCPRLAPVVAASRSRHHSNGRSSTDRSNVATWLGEGGRSSARRTRGGEASAAGLTQIHPHRCACTSARCSTAWTRWTVPGDSPPPSRPPQRSRRPYTSSMAAVDSSTTGTGPRYGSRYTSMTDRVCATVVGAQPGAAAANQRSSSSPTVPACVRARSTSATSSFSSATAARREPRTVRVTYR